MSYLGRIDELQFELARDALAVLDLTAANTVVRFDGRSVGRQCWLVCRGLYCSFTEICDWLLTRPFTANQKYRRPLVVIRRHNSVGLLIYHVT